MADVEVNLTCGDTITAPTMPKVGSYRFCIHCDTHKKVTGPAHAGPDMAGPTQPYGTAESTTCGCYSCAGECGGTADPDSCGPLELVAGQPICDSCRADADVFADRDSRRYGIKVLPALTGDDQAAPARVCVKAPVFGNPQLLNLSPEMARQLAAALIIHADEAGRYNTNQQAPGCLCVLGDPAAYCPVHTQADEDAKHAGEQWPPGSGFPRQP